LQPTTGWKPGNPSCLNGFGANAEKALEKGPKWMGHDGGEPCHFYPLKIPRYPLWEYEA